MSAKKPTLCGIKLLQKFLASNNINLSVFMIERYADSEIDDPNILQKNKEPIKIYKTQISRYVRLEAAGNNHEMLDFRISSPDEKQYIRFRDYRRCSPEILIDSIIASKECYIEYTSDLAYFLKNKHQLIKDITTIKFKRNYNSKEIVK